MEVRSFDDPSAGSSEMDLIKDCAGHDTGMLWIMMCAVFQKIRSPMLPILRPTKYYGRVQFGSCYDAGG